MEIQNYDNHRRYIPMYHFVLFLLLIALFIGSIVNVVKSIGGPGIYSASLLIIVSVTLMFIFYYARLFGLKAQDRAIRAEENLRHFVLTGKLLSRELTIRQIIALRFAEDTEFVKLAEKAIKDNMSENDIKKAIKNWKEDHYRV